MSVKIYSLDDFYNIYKQGLSYSLEPCVCDILDSLNQTITPLFVEKNTPEKRNDYRSNPHDHKSRKHGTNHGHGFSHNKQCNNGKESWNNYSRISFKPTTLVEKKEGIEQWINEIRMCLNKLSTANYDNQKTMIFDCLNKCIHYEGQTQEMCDENVKKIVTAVFHIASTNKYYAGIYAKLYKELMDKQPICHEILLNHVNNYTSSIKDIECVDPVKDYEKFCVVNKLNDARKATCLFFVHLMREKILPVLRVLNIMVAFQTSVMDLINIENKTAEVDEITEILFLFLQEGKDIFAECKAEWIWKFVIKQNIDTLSKCKKNDKKSLSSRAIFKYMDMAKFVQEK